jgi:hypothetical protein
MLVNSFDLAKVPGDGWLGMALLAQAKVNVQTYGLSGVHELTVDKVAYIVKYCNALLCSFKQADSCRFSGCPHWLESITAHTCKCRYASIIVSPPQSNVSTDAPPIDVCALVSNHASVSREI